MITPTFDFEQELWKKGYKRIAGVDEVGRGAWAGPLVAAVVILPDNYKLLNDLIKEGVRDSKLITAKKREKLAKIIKEAAVSFTIVESSVMVINKRGVGFANKSALKRAAKNIGADWVLVDGLGGIVKGDQKSVSIASASIIAKVYRDNLMSNLYNEKYPVYEFFRHKGYGTKLHQERIKEYGICRIHRVKFIHCNM